MDDLTCPGCGAEVAVDLRWRPSFRKHLGRPLLWVAGGVAFMAAVIAWQGMLASGGVLAGIAALFGLAEGVGEIWLLFQKDREG